METVDRLQLTWYNEDRVRIFCFMVQKREWRDSSFQNLFIFNTAGVMCHLAATKIPYFIIFWIVFLFLQIIDIFGRRTLLK